MGGASLFGFNQCSAFLNRAQTPKLGTTEAEQELLHLFYIAFHSFQSKKLLRQQSRTLGGGGEGGDAPIFWKTIVFCSKTMEMFDVILPKQ